MKITGGSFAATNGASTDAISFGVAFPTACQSVAAVLVPPTPAGPFLSCWLAALPSQTGFTVQYAAPIPLAGYKIFYTAIGI